MRIKSVCLWGFAAVLLTACGRNDTPGVQVEVHRYDKFLMELEPGGMQQGLQAGVAEFDFLLQGADLESAENLQRIRRFVEDPVVKLSYRKAEETYGNGALEKSLGVLFARIQKVLPGFTPPRVYTYISYYDVENRIIYADSVLVIALDLYLNRNEKQVEEWGYPRYICRRMTPEYLLPDIARAVAARHLPETEKDAQNTLLDYMAREGKILSFMQEVLPGVKPEILLGYTREEYLWSRAHEKEIWQYIVKQNLLFETDAYKLRYFISEGPSNPVLPGAPARLAGFSGWRMAQQYLKKTKGGMAELWGAGAPQILKQSRYKP